MLAKHFQRWLAVILLAAGLAQTEAQLQRVPNTTLQFPSTPPQFGYMVTNAFPGLTLSSPVCIASPPGETNRLFILEKGGTIVVITNLVSPNRTVFMSLTVLSDSESGLLGLAFHPGYATNGYFFVFSSRSLNTSQGNGRHQVISRFEVSAGNPNQGDAGKEVMLIRQFDSAGNHNGGDLHFGLDGYLYASVGDEGAQYNGSLNAQVITNKFFSAILRLDVDKRAGNPPPNTHAASSTNYAIPASNPYIGLTNFYGRTVDPTKIRTEFYSIGYRNPWRMSFDRATGFLYVGDVGQDQYEEVSVITNGANAGWAYYEGVHLAKTLYPSQSTILTNPPAGLVFPIQEYPHSGSANYRGNAVIGGVVYRGSRISQLYGAYVFSDNGSGKVWMLRYDGTNTVPFQYIADATQPSAFGTDPRNGDILIAQLTTNQIGKLIYNSTPTGTPLPPTLADTGAFSSLATLTPNAGIVPYDLNVPFWSDNAIKSRWFSVPNTNLTIGFNPTNNWSFPTGSVWIKNFELELTNGVPASRKRLETRFIVRNTNGVYGVTYRWTTPPTNAILVAEEGLDEVFTNYNSGGGIAGTQTWHYPSRVECFQCHSSAGGHALGFNTPQLNRAYAYGAATTNQLRALSVAGYFNTNVTGVDTLLALAHATNTAASLEFRVRSYLSANCSQCHQPGGLAPTFWNASIWTQMADAGIINGALFNNLGDTNNRVIVPGSLANSVLLTRISTPALRMPPIASTVLDTQAIALVTSWIGSLSGGTSNFSLTASPPSETVTPGGVANYTVTVAATNGFTGNVTVSVSGLPAGANYTLTPTNVNTSGTSTLSVTTSTNVAPGDYSLTITGTSGSLTHSTTVTLSVNDFGISAAPASRIVTVGDSTNYAVTIGSSNEFGGTVTLSVSGLPAGAGYSLTPTNVSGSGPSTLSVTTSTNVAPGDYSLTITGTSGSLTHSTTATLSVNDFGISAVPASQTVMVGYGTNYSVAVNASNAFSGNVALSVSGLPAGADYSLTPTNVSGSDAATLSVTTSNNVALGDYLLTITGTAGSLAHNATVTLQVIALPTPRFTTVTLFETSLILSGTNGIPNGNYYVLNSTNLTQPLADWTLMATNVFDANGEFTFTNAIDPNTPQLFYRLQLP